MPIMDENKTDDFDRNETVIGDSEDPSRKAGVDSEGNLRTRTKFYSDQYDAWGRLRASSPNTLFELNFNSSARPLSMNTLTASGGTSTYSYNKSGVDMTVNTTSGSRVVRQTRRYFRYVTGKGTKILTATVPGLPQSNTIKRWGSFDDRDGVFVDQNGGGLGVVLRSSTSGTPVDTRVAQANWNLDTMDGTGPSGIDLDPEAYNVWVIDYSWQGVGKIRYGLFVGNETIYFHEIINFNTSNVPLSRTPVLPVRYEIVNTGTTASSSTMYHGTLGVIIEGGSNIFDPALGFTASNQATAVNIGTTLTPIIAIRPKLTFNGNTNRVPIELTNINVSATTQLVYFQVIQNPTITFGTPISAGNDSAVEYSVNASGVSGGQKIGEGYVLAASQGSRQTLDKSAVQFNKLNFIGLNIQGTQAESIVIVARTITQTTNVYAVINWEEFQ